MSLAQRIASLEHLHAEQEAALREECAHPWHDDRKIVQLKRSKLRLRDQIKELRGRDERKPALVHCRSDTS